ncbi:hypothetical protein HAP94_00305 [Acidithiobacillus ferrivorans]|uniref:Uncharacterized protein n=1 Tax=mine drainage metagenome TaxID=410659 RepID=E6QJA5_9ZZZZ|nr:hypothetical protein [Acidithiobacillus ferrivorans]
MVDEILSRRVLAFEDRNVWITAYAAWYQHFLAMQPCQDHIATSWARKMAEASLVDFYRRDDQDQIRQAAASMTALLVSMCSPAPVPASPAPTFTNLTPDIAFQSVTSRKLAQISLFS